MKGVGLLKHKQARRPPAFTMVNGFLVFWEFLLRERQIQRAQCLTPELAVKLGSIMEIQIMLIGMKFYSANVYFTLLCGEVQSGCEEADNVLFICKMLWRICGLGYFKTATWRDSYIWKQYYPCTLIANGERSTWKQLPSLPVRMCRSCWKKAGVVENFSGPVGQDMGPALLYRPGAVLIPVSWGNKQLLEK